MHTKPLFAMTLLLLGTQSLTACTIVDATGDDDTSAGEQDAATSDDTTDETTTDDTNTSEGDGGAGTSDESDDTDATSNDEDAAPTDDTDDTTEPEDEEDGGETEEPEGDGGETDPTEPEDEDSGTGDTVSKTGYVQLTQMAFGAGEIEVVTTTAGAGFTISTYDQGSGAPVFESPCETKTVGSCTLTECEITGDGGAFETPDSASEAVSAGIVKITGLTEDVTLNPGENDSYTPGMGSARWWSGGEELVASAPGSGEVPEFSIDLVAPDNVTVSSPDLSGLEIDVSRSEDFQVTWEDGDTGTVTLSLMDSSESPMRQIACVVPATANGVIVDESLLADFGDTGALTMNIGNSSIETVEEWSLTFSAMSMLANAAVSFED